MRSLYKIVRASQITLENQKYVLSTDITFKHHRIPETDDESVYLDERTEGDEEVQAQSLLDRAHYDAQTMRQEAQDYADELMASAKADADRMITDAYDQVQQILESARQKGHEEGYQNGLEQAEREAKGRLEEALRVKNEMILKHSQVLRDSEQEIVALVLNCVEKILQKRIDEDQELILDLVKIGIEKCLFSGTLTLRVAEEDFDQALGLKNAILILTENIEDIVIKRDKALKPGSCILDTQSGSVDSGVWTQFEQIRASFEALLSEGNHSDDTQTL